MKHNAFLYRELQESRWLATAESDHKIDSQIGYSRRINGPRTLPIILVGPYYDDSLGVLRASTREEDWRNCESEESRYSEKYEEEKGAKRLLAIY